jgi:hypothetical protein
MIDLILALGGFIMGLMAFIALMCIWANTGRLVKLLQKKVTVDMAVNLDGEEIHREIVEQ